MHTKSWRRVFALAMVLGLLGGCGGGGSDVTAAGTPSTAQMAATNTAAPATISRRAVVPNPTGLRVGFWEVYNKQAYTLQTMGKRPSSRVGFDNWNAFELSKGVYTFPGFGTQAKVHNYGESVLAAINISFTTLITPQKQTIPSFYKNDIDDPTTRAAAKKFLYAYVQQMLKSVGAVTLTIDYEIVSNWRLSEPGSEARAAQWGAWYVEAAAVARQAAADLGKTGQLKLQPIVNGDPFDPGNPIALGAAHNPWLTQVVAASDALALDTYHSDAAKPVTDPGRTVDIIAFWINTYAGNKNVVVTENGFTTITEQNPNITRADRDMKLTGTNAEQAAYYQALFPALLAANRPDGAFHNKLRGYHLWSIIDYPGTPDSSDQYFGLLDHTGALKPSAPIVKAAIAGLEADSFNQPYTQSPMVQDVTATLATGSTPVALTYKEGDEYQFLRYSDKGAGTGKTVHLQVAFGTLGNLMVSVNGNWLYVENRSSFDVDVTPYYRSGAANTLDLFATGVSFPVTQSVKSVKLVRY